MHLAWTELQKDIAATAGELELLGLLAIVRDEDPLTFPELVEALPRVWQVPGNVRLVLSAQPRVVLWDGLSEVAAAALARLFVSGQLALQPCNPGIYKFAARRLVLPAVHVIPVVPRHDCWLTCTIGIGPVPCLNSEWKIGYCAPQPSN